MKRALLYLSCVACFVLCFSSCKYSNEYETINVANTFSVSVPSWLKEEKTLAAGAAFQHANRFRNFYAVGFILQKDSMQSSFGDAWNNTLISLKKSLTTPLVTDSIVIEVNGMKGNRAEILGKMDGENIYFSEVMLDGKKNVYHLSVWVRGEERKLRFKEDINRIIASVKEL